METPVSAADRNRPTPPYFLRSASGVYLVANEAETIQSHLLATGQFEPLGPLLAGAVLSVRSGLVIDVGANLGTFTIPVALLSPETRVIACEPQRTVHWHLCTNLLLNRLYHVRALNVALGASPGLIAVPVFDPFRERYTGSVTLDPGIAAVRARIPGVAEPARHATEFLDTEMTTLDALAGDTAVAFVKIDVEGMELEVLKGGEALFAKQRPVVFSEAWNLPEFAEHRRALFSWLAAVDYEVRDLDDDFIAIPGEAVSALLPAMQEALR